MLKAFMTYGGYRAAGLAAPFVLSIGFEQYDKFVNYAPVEARVVKVLDRCYMEKRSGGKIVKSNDYDCASVESAVRNNPLWQGSAITYDINIDFQYVSPADGQLHVASRALTAWPGGRRMNQGDIVSIRASKNDPSEIIGI